MTSHHAEGAVVDRRRERIRPVLVGSSARGAGGWHPDGPRRGRHLAGAPTISRLSLLGLTAVEPRIPPDGLMKAVSDSSGLGVIEVDQDVVVEASDDGGHNQDH